MYTRFLLVARSIVADHRAEYNDFYIMFGGGGTTSTTQNTAPWSGQQPFLSQQYQAAANLYNNPADYPQFFPGAAQGSEVAPLNTTQNTALSGLSSLGMNSPLLNQDTATQQAILSGSLLGAGNPYQQQEFNAINAQVTPQIESQFTQGNSMNNPAAAYATAQGVGSADAAIAGQNYNTGLNQITQESLYAPQTYQDTLAGMNTALNAGNQLQTQSQNVLNNQINAYNYNQQLPYQMLNQYAGYIAGNPGSSVTSQQPYYNNTAQNLFGDALGAAAVFSMF